MASTNPARGMRDFLPSDVRKREYVIGIIKEVYESYGFEPLETPAVENLETLMGKYGEEGNQLVFKILKRGEKLDESLTRGDARSELADLALRYDLTVPLARVVANNKNDLPKFFKRYQIQPVWRADRPARGRFREFYQCDVDAIGSNSMVVEAELMSAVSEIFKRLGFMDVTIRLNHRQVLTDILDTAGVPEDLHSDALVAIDKLDKIGAEGVAKELKERGISETASTMLMEIFAKTQEILNQEKDVNRTIVANLLNIVSNETLTELGQILKFADKAPILIDPSLARGLSYYTGAIMEANVPDLAGSLGGGGRYDGLIGMFGKEQIPACGFSLGLERILVVMEEKNMFPPEIADATPADVMVTVWSEESVSESLRLAQELRVEGLRTFVYPEPKDKLGKQLKYAASINIPQVAIVGPDSASKNLINIRDLNLGEQMEVSPPPSFDEMSLQETRKMIALMEMEVFYEFLALSTLEVKRNTIVQERYPKPDFSCDLDSKRHYFEIKILTNSANIRGVIKESLSRAYYTPDGIPNLIFCHEFDWNASVASDYAKISGISSFEEFPYWNWVFFYDRKRKNITKVL